MLARRDFFCALAALPWAVMPVGWPEEPAVDLASGPDQTAYILWSGPTELMRVFETLEECKKAAREITGIAGLAA